MWREESNGTVIRDQFFYMVYWIAYLFFFSVQRLFAMKEVLGSIDIREQLIIFKVSFLTNLIFLPVVVGASHFVVSYLLPKYCFRSRYIMFSLLVGLTVFLYPLVIFLMRVLFVDDLFPNPDKYSFNNYFSAMLIFVFGMAPLAWFEIAKHMRAEEKIRLEIDTDRLEALLKLKETELKLLKNQIQPHFLFNTLNNLYSLAIEKSEKTPELIIRLSDMLSYIIYDCKSEKVPVSKEIDFIKNYIELQKVRFETCDIRFSFKNNSDEKLIAPMIIHTFVDNCFKHGAENDSGNPWINIFVSSFNGSLFLAAINSKKPAEGDNPGIGIANTMKRLDLIYKDKYDIVLHNSQKKYAVFLKIQL
ncbi:MAG TPA: sensor histidine kinase [Bacteroidales bacterium]|nr:sensor histidine kinase [Bacteroidales bacterium]